MIDQDKRERYSRARITKDKNYDGRFFFGVKTTGIFCRPSCPSPVANEENVVYLNSIFNAIELGYRPCIRCRPDISLEYHNSYISGSDTVQTALNMIYSGFLNYNSIKDLARELCISERQLRKLFSDSIGLPPIKISRYHKSVFAKKMLLSSSESITSIAFASGFRSTRQFNSTYKELFGESPSSTRKERSEGLSGKTNFLLHYKPPLDFGQMLAFLEPRLISGVEMIKGNMYLRTFRSRHARGWFSVCDRPELNALELSINSEDVRCYMEIYYRVRRMFDLDTDFTAVNAQFKEDPLLRRGMRDGRVPAMPAAFDPFEFVIRAILGQQITVKAATTLAGRMAEASAIPCTGAPGNLRFYFPTAKELNLTDIKNIGITGTRQQTIRNVTNAVLECSISLSAGQSLEEFSRGFSKVKGIGDWTVNYTAMRGLGMKDAFPASDLGIIKALTKDGCIPTVKEIIRTSEKWRPYRSYAALCLWNIRPDA